MKTLSTLLIAALAIHELLGANPTKELNPQLLEIFERMMAKDRISELEGKEFEVDLTVKAASEKFLIFSDAYLQFDEETKYQIGKWAFESEQVAGLRAKQGDMVTVRFIIEKVRVEAPYLDMPHFTAKIVYIGSHQDAADQGN